MPKIKITSGNSTQQTNVISKCRTWGAGARDGNYDPVSGKTAVVVDTKLGGGVPALQMSRVDFNPSKRPYDRVISYKDFMNLNECPWDSGKAIRNGGGDGSVQVREVQVQVAVPTPSGVCAQETLKVKSCVVLEQEKTIFNQVGLPAIQELGIEVTMVEDEAYILDIAKNKATPVTAKSAAQHAKNAIEDNDTENVWAVWARSMDLVTDVVMVKMLDDEEVSSVTSDSDSEPA